ncbi:MAG: hypothetical protein OMM_12440 [Candidatus Magnetoglobus multicellularis str. Araruama]|uniref:SD-repeat containing protein B domain-containing protein n=1 Tax=Candidatus Magnetoglobus multicellularis str. Araruama TaxID=890399 RepID=A0A1V1NVY4_9BACT|nr:MAG: hypothetical protein OMM_12440 [Candidatus Magnetoglobus multicellularis str. Araruama]
MAIPNKPKSNVCAGDEINFILSNNEITGNVTDINGTLPPTDTIVKVYLYEFNAAKWIFKTTTDKSGNFVFKGLDGNTSYQLFFRAVGSLLESPGQWAGMDNIGVSKNDRTSASNMVPGNEINFKFTGEWNVGQQ